MAAVARAEQAFGQRDVGFRTSGISAQAPASSNLSRKSHVPTTSLSPTQHSPPHSTTPSPSSCSPTSPQQQGSAFAKREPRAAQIGRPKNVGFVPAALRPTTRPRPPPGAGHAKAHSIAALRNGPPTPPHSLHNSSDNLAGTGMPPQTASTRTASFRTSPSSSLSANTSAPRLARIDTEITADKASLSGPASARPSTRGSVILTSPSSSFAALSFSSMVTQQPPHPTRAHWKPDAMATSCDDSSCSTAFSTFTRRHHCRRCGYIFCSRHVARRVPLDANACAVPTPLQTPDQSAASTPHLSLGSTAGSTPDETEDNPEVGWWRACDRCWSEWVEWVEGLQQQRAAGDQTAFSDRMHLPGTLTIPSSIQRKSSVAGSLGSSVPRDWNWSTF